MLMIAFGTDVLANATYSAVNMYYFKYVLGREDLVSPVATAILVGSIISIPLLPPLTKLIGKRDYTGLEAYYPSCHLLLCGSNLLHRLLCL